LSILRATQFYPLVDMAMSWAARLPVLAGPADVPGRPVDPAEVAARLIEAVDSGPSLAVAVLRQEPLVSVPLRSREAP
jgi:hypothetical protein